MFLESGNDELEVAGNNFRRGPFLEVVGANEQHHALGVERQHVLLQADEHAARGVTADAAVGHLHALEVSTKLVAPSLRDGIAQEHQRTHVLSHTGRPAGPFLFPKILKPLITPDRPLPRQSIIRSWNGKLRASQQIEAEDERQKQIDPTCFHRDPMVVHEES